mgnify:CR=1 FL=1
MKKSLIALAVAAFGAASANAAAVYDKDGTSLSVSGEMEAMYWSNHASGNSAQDQTVSDRARINFDGRTELSSGISAYGFYEWETEHNGDSTEATDLSARYAYAGVDFGKFGKVQVGRYEDPFEYAGNVVDNLEETGLICGMDERNSGHLSYMWSGYGFDAGASYQFATDKYNADMFGTVDVNGGFSVYAGYTSPAVLFGPISVRAAYLYLDAQNIAHEGTIGNFWDEDAEQYDVDNVVKNIKSSDFGLAWGTMGDGFYVATHYNVSLLSGYDKTSEASGSVKFKIWESMVSYGFDNGVVLSAAYSNVIGEVNDEDGYDKKKVNTAELIASYDVNENFRVWAEATIDCNSDDGAYSYFYAKGSGKLDDDGEEIYEGTNAVMIGARYTF